MCECKDSQDLLTTAAYEALMAADRLAEAIRAAEVAQALTHAQLDLLRDLRPAAITPTQISVQAVEALRGLAEGLQPKIRAETVTWFVQSENDPSCGDQEVVTSDNVLCREILAAQVSRSWGIRCPGCPDTVAQTGSAVKK